MTIRGCEPWLADWIAHHRQIFDQLLIWIDEPAEFAAAQALSEARVTILPGQRAEGTSRLTRVLISQMANAELACELCARDGIDWLLHIDADELFLEHDPSVWESPADRLVFANHECVPVWAAERPLQAVTHFKAHGRMPFLLYSNGKSAVRCRAGGERPRADGPHRFTGPGTEEMVAHTRASVLHYACPTFDLWWEKYRHLGAFSDHWYDRPAQPIELPFHLRSRDLVAGALASGDRGACEAFFRELVLPEAEIARLCGEGRVLTVARNAAGRVHPA